MNENPAFLDLFGDTVLPYIGSATASHTPDARKAVQIARKSLFLAERKNFDLTNKCIVFSIIHFVLPHVSLKPSSNDENLVVVTMEMAKQSFAELEQDPKIELIPTLSKYQKILLLSLLLVRL